MSVITSKHLQSALVFVPDEYDGEPTHPAWRGVHTYAGESIGGGYRLLRADDTVFTIPYEQWRVMCPWPIVNTDEPNENAARFAAFAGNVAVDMRDLYIAADRNGLMTFSLRAAQ